MHIFTPGIAWMNSDCKRTQVPYVCCSSSFSWWQSKNYLYTLLVRFALYYDYHHSEQFANWLQGFALRSLNPRPSIVNIVSIDPHIHASPKRQLWLTPLLRVIFMLSAKIHIYGLINQAIFYLPWDCCLLIHLCAVPHCHSSSLATPSPSTVDAWRIAFYLNLMALTLGIYIMNKD